jgi:aminocarboxymuconate-semialdehyde decarboxylase
MCESTGEYTLPTRREFFQDVAGAIAGIVFVGCGLVGVAEAQSQSGSTAPRRQVVVDGRRVQTVDMHTHCAVPEAMALTGRNVSPQALLMVQEPMQERLRQMDAQGIDVEVLSINPYWYGAEHDLARHIIKIQNEKLAEMCAVQPDRFVAFATVALQYPDLAAQQLEEGVKQLGLRGASIGGSVNGEELSDPKFHPFWAKAEELGALIFLHPQGIPDLEKRLQGNGLLTNVIGNPLETTIALSHLIFEGTLDRFPGLKLCAAHGGGYLPSTVLGRITAV